MVSAEVGAGGSGELRADILLQDGGCAEIEWDAVAEVAVERRWIAPVDVPAMVDGDQDVLAGDDEGEVVTAVGVGLVAAKFGDAAGFIDGDGDKQHHRADCRLAVDGCGSGDGGAAGGDVNSNRGLAAGDGDHAAGNLFGAEGQAGEEEVGAASLIDEVASGRKVQGAGGVVRRVLRSGLRGRRSRPLRSLRVLQGAVLDLGATLELGASTFGGGGGAEDVAVVSSVGEDDGKGLGSGSSIDLEVDGGGDCGGGQIQVAGGVGGDIDDGGAARLTIFIRRLDAIEAGGEPAHFELAWRVRERGERKGAVRRDTGDLGETESATICVRSRDIRGRKGNAEVYGRDREKLDISLASLSVMEGDGLGRVGASGSREPGERVDNVEGGVGRRCVWTRRTERLCSSGVPDMCLDGDAVVAGGEFVAATIVGGCGGAGDRGLSSVG